MAWGKARFWAKKFTNFKQSLFNVKTQTAVVGVRGSEWVEEVTEDSTKVTAFENTVLAVTSTAAPEIEPTVVEDFQQTVIDAGELPSEVVEVSTEEIEQMKKEFTVTPEGEDTGAKVEVQKKEEKKEVAVKEEAEEKAAAEEGAEEEAVDMVLVSEGALVDPDPIIAEETEEGFDLDTVIIDLETADTTVIEDTIDEVIEEAPPEPPPETEGSITINW
jgi:2,4-dienoyl-CoA reductase-like NADH-dependent reductase (Old Yellow Enzyme family)